MAKTEAEKQRDRVNRLRGQIEAETNRQAEKLAGQEDQIRAARLKAEGDRLEAELAALKERGKAAAEAIKGQVAAVSGETEAQREAAASGQTTDKDGDA